MNWEEAKIAELKNWMAIRDAIGKHDLMTIRNWMNRTGELCRLARLAASALGETSVCDRCRACQEFGGCHEIRQRVYEALVVGDLEGARTTLDGFLGNLARLEAPSELVLCAEGHA